MAHTLCPNCYDGAHNECIEQGCYCQCQLNQETTDDEMICCGYCGCMFTNDGGGLYCSSACEDAANGDEGMTYRFRAGDLAMGKRFKQDKKYHKGSRNPGELSANCKKPKHYPTNCSKDDCPCHCHVALIDRQLRSK